MTALDFNTLGGEILGAYPAVAAALVPHFLQRFFSLHHRACAAHARVRCGIV